MAIYEKDAKDQSPPGPEPEDTFFLLHKYTEEGIRNVKQQGERVKRASDLVRGSGAAKCSFYLTVAGPYDMISVVTGISDLNLARLVLAVNSLGTVQTTVVKSLHFYGERYAEFLKDLP